ncbi:MAG TPA: aminotransferase class V-fold PLP-dependent enzyme [Vicinamibacterales bacterium]|nr:aminotransferase class V-fold PLP-dependent enzyme [Vicinamibacterales bacterium]
MPTEWTAAEIRRVGRLVVDLIADHITSLPDEPTFRPFPADLAEQMTATPAPAEGVAPDEILRIFTETIEPYPFGNGHPRFWGWVNSPPALMGVFADALAAAMNPSCAGGNHAAIHLERQVLQWFRDLLGFPDESMGLLVSGGSMATMTALAVARYVKAGVDVRRDGLRSAPQPFAFYMTSEGHSCARKAIELLGFGSASIRTVPTTADFTMDVAALDAAIAADREAGVRPIAAIATAGTTNTGAIDDLAAIAGVCRRHGVWMHVDAAYGGAAIVSRAYGDEIAALAHGDSVALDPHKWLFVPVEAGLVFVKDGEAMRSAFSLVPPYIRTTGSAGEVYGLPWFSEYGFQQTRGFRALKVWMTLQQFGIAGYKAVIEENIALARHLAGQVESDPDFALMAPPGLSIVCFRYVGALASEDQIVAANRAILERLQLGGDAFITSTELGGRFVLRACIVNYRSTRADVDRLLDAVRAIGRAVIAA